MNDFESFYNKLCIMYEPKANMINDEYKSIKRASAKKVVPYFAVELIIAVIIAYYFKTIETFYIFLMPIIFSIIQYAILTRKGVGENEIFKTDIHKQIFKNILDEFNKNLEYEEYNGFDEKTYVSLFDENYSFFHSMDRINGILNDNNKFYMSYVSTTSNDADGDSITVFGGYVLDIDLNKSYNLNVSVNRRKYKYLDDNKDESNEYLLDQIKELIKDYYDKNIKAQCVIKGNKLYIRSKYIECKPTSPINALDKKKIEDMYLCFKNFTEFAEKIVIVLDK